MLSVRRGLITLNHNGITGPTCLWRTHLVLLDSLDQGQR